MQNQFANHFELFGLKAQFTLDLPSLERAYREIQARVHPDRFAGAGAAEQRLSMQWTTQVNEAYRVLRRPLQRAAYLLELQSIDPKFETDTAMPRQFLLRQMELREALEEASLAKDPDNLDRLRAQLREDIGAAETELAKCLDEAQDYAAAVPLVRELMFLERLDAEIDAAFESLET